MRLLKDLRFLAVSVDHFVVDALNGVPAILLAAFSVPFGLTNAAVGLLITLYGLAGALFQPFFGVASDRFGGKWLLVGGLFWMGTFFALVGLFPGEAALVFLLIAGLGSGAFHPAGTMDAADFSRRGLAGKAATGAALFFLFGQIGSAIGPAAGGALIEAAGMSGLLALAALCLPAILLTILTRRGSTAPSRAHPSEPRLNLANTLSGLLRVEFVLILVMAVLRFWVQASTQAFLPKLLMEQGFSSTMYGALTGLFMVGAAVGGIAGGLLGDRIGSFPILLGATALSVVPFFLLPVTTGPLLPAVILAAGLLGIAPHSIQVTMAQNAVPGQSGLASGMILGSMFTLGGIGVFLSGLAADRIGLTTVLQANALLCALGAGIGLALWSLTGRHPTGEGALLPVEDLDRLPAGGGMRAGGA